MKKYWVSYRETPPNTNKNKIRNILDEVKDKYYFFLKSVDRYMS